MQTKTFKGEIGVLALILGLAGCDSGERIQDPSSSQRPIGATDLTGSSEFDRELIAAKSQGSDQEHREQAIVAVLDKYGVAHPKVQAQFLSIPSIAGAAAKTARSFWDPTRRNFTAGNDIHTYHGAVTVPNRGHLRLGAIANTASVDPFMVAYYGSTSQPSQNAFNVVVVGYNDDVASGNRNSIIEWTNNTGGAKLVGFIAFAFSQYSRGKGTIQITVDGSSTNLLNREIGGLIQYDAIALPPAPDGCTIPVSTLATFTTLSGGGYGESALLIDTKALGGAIILGRPAPVETITFPWIVNNPYPSFALLYEPVSGVLPANWSENPSNYQFIQKEHYSCVN
jgi:hypothetical protein